MRHTIILLFLAVLCTTQTVIISVTEGTEPPKIWPKRAEYWVPVRPITHGSGYHWFGYYDKLEFDPSGRYVLAMEVDFQDRQLWVEATMNGNFGDSNLDGQFNSRDLVDVFAAGEFEDDIALNSTWTTGDWDGDGDFESDDIILSFGEGGYERGPRAAAPALPEPTSLATRTIGVLGIAFRRRRDGMIFFG